MTFHVFFMYPETVGRSLEEIDLLFDSNVRPWKTAAVHDQFGDEVERHKSQVAKEQPETAHQEVV